MLNRVDWSPLLPRKSNGLKYLRFAFPSPSSLQMMLGEEKSSIKWQCSHHTSWGFCWGKGHIMCWCNCWPDFFAILGKDFEISIKWSFKVWRQLDLPIFVFTHFETRKGFFDTLALCSGRWSEACGGEFDPRALWGSVKTSLVKLFFFLSWAEDRIRCPSRDRNSLKCFRGQTALSHVKVFLSKVCPSRLADSSVVWYEGWC